MSGKKKRLRETVVEDVGSGLECEESARDCDDLADLIEEMQKGQKAKGTPLGKQQKVDTVVVSDEDVIIVGETVNTTNVKCAKPPAQKTKKKRNRSKKKALNLSGGSSIATSSDSQKQVSSNKVSTGSADQANEYHIQTRLKTESPVLVLQPKKKKRRKKKTNVNKTNGGQELNISQASSVSNGEAEVTAVITVSDHSIGDPLLATADVIDLTSEDSTLEDPSSVEPYNRDEVTQAQISMEWEMSHGPLNFFLRKLKIRNTAANFVPRTSNMENEYWGLQDDFPMPSTS